MEAKYCVVMTTYSDEGVGKKIIDSLIEQKLAACIQVQEVNSFFFWKGEVNKEKESLLFIKTKHSLYDKVEKCIKENHSYEVPEIIELPIINGSQAYFNWIEEVCL
ncbi:MAG: divalent-cation tolerance protein CutA [Patescibacteria group bacterium]